MARFLVAFGLVPLLLARLDVSQVDPPWALALAPAWSPAQLVTIAVAGLGFGATSRRPVQTLAAVALGLLAGLAIDLWWLAGWVKPYDQTFVSMLPQSVWRSDLAVMALAMVGVAAAGVVAGAIVRRWFRDRSGPPRRRPTGSEALAIAVAVIAAPLFAIGIASTAASSALVVPDGAHIQAVTVSSGGISVDPAVLQSGPTRFRCHFAVDATADWAGLVPVPTGVDAESVPASFDASVTICGQMPGTSTWGAIAELVPGRYMWIQVEQTEVPRVVARSQVVAVEP